MRFDRCEPETALGPTPIHVAWRRPAHATAPLARALASWGLLLGLRAALAPTLGAGAALGIGLLAALAPLVAWQRDGDPRRLVPELEPCALGVALGFLLLPLILLPVGELGLALELGEDVQDTAPLRAGSLWLSGALLAPLWEELLYRGLLMRALAARFGAAAALLGVTALSTACHGGPGSLLVAAAAGLVLGGVMLASDSLALCIGLHAGLNLAALAAGGPPFRDPAVLLALPPPALPLAGAALWLASCSRLLRSPGGPSRRCPTRGSRC